MSRLLFTTIRTLDGPRHDFMDRHILTVEFVQRYSDGSRERQVVEYIDQQIAFIADTGEVIKARPRRRR